MTETSPEIVMATILNDYSAVSVDLFYRNQTVICHLCSLQTCS